MAELFVGLIHGIVRVGVLWPSFCEKWCVWSVCASCPSVLMFLNIDARLLSFQAISYIRSFWVANYEFHSLALSIEHYFIFIVNIFFSSAPSGQGTSYACRLAQFFFLFSLLFSILYIHFFPLRFYPPPILPYWVNLYYIIFSPQPRYFTGGL